MQAQLLTPAGFESVPREASAPGRVRWAIYLAFALIALVSLAQSWLARDHERLLRADAEVLAMAGVQRSFVQSVGRQAAVAAFEARDGADLVAALDLALARSKVDAPRS